MFERLLAHPHRDHIPPHRIWASVNASVPLGLPDFVHMATCANCWEFYEICLKAENFGEALGIWLAEHDVDKAGELQQHPCSMMWLRRARRATSAFDL